MFLPLISKCENTVLESDCICFGQGRGSDGVEELKEVEEKVDAKAGLELKSMVVEKDLRSKKLKKNSNKEIGTSSNGQLISKCHFSVVDSSKIATKIL